MVKYRVISADTDNMLGDDKIVKVFGVCVEQVRETILKANKDAVILKVQRVGVTPSPKKQLVTICDNLVKAHDEGDKPLEDKLRSDYHNIITELNARMKPNAFEDAQKYIPKLPKLY